MSDRSARLAGLYAMLAAGIMVVLAPLLALSYVATDAGREELETGTVAAWAEPGRELAGGLLTWASPERVYVTYWQAFALLVPAMFLCAHAARARRSPAGRGERWGWRIALTGYLLEKVGFLALFLALVVADLDSTAVDVIFLGAAFPGLLIGGVGSTILGISLVRSGARPRLTAWLLASALPSMIVVPALLGNLALGLLPVFVAWAAVGRQLRQAAPVLEGVAGVGAPRRASVGPSQDSAAAARRG